MAETNIQVIKLTTGEDIIGNVHESEIGGAKVIVITKPCILLLRPKEEDPKQIGLGLAPWSPYAKDYQVPIIPAHILSIFHPEESLVKEYLRRTTTDVKVDTSNVEQLRG